MPKLADLDFTDLYVRLDGRDPSRYAPVARRGLALPRNMPVPEEYESEIETLRHDLLRQPHDDFALDIDEMRLRGSRSTLFGEQTWVALRRLPLDPPDLDKLGFRPEILQEFRSWGARSGLIVVGGATRAGKTTTLVGLLTDFLKNHGGVGYTVEDPVEFYLQGEHGQGNFCFQQEVHADHEWGEAVKKALRWAPRYIFLGEVRTPAAAKWLLRAATSGHLAMCTVHGGSIEETLSAILQIAQAELGDTAPAVLADGLCAVVHQSLVQGRPNVHVLTTDPQAADPVRAAIRSGKLQTLGTTIEAQSAIRKTNARNAAAASLPTAPLRRDVEAGEAEAARQSPGTARAAAANPAQAAKKKGWFGG